MKKVFLCLLAVVLLLGVVACAQPAVSGETIKSEKPRITSPQVSGAELTALTSGNSAFAFDLYQALRGTDGNIFYFPYSISLALAMTYGGARGETEKQMADTLHFTLPQNVCIQRSIAWIWNLATVAKVLKARMREASD